MTTISEKHRQVREERGPLQRRSEADELREQIAVLAERSGTTPEELEAAAKKRRKDRENGG